VHGFDEFFGYLYHLDAMSDPYWFDYPHDWINKTGPRDLIHSAALTPFRATKGTTFEGGFRVPAIIRWPGKVKPGSVENGIFSGLDWLPTLTAAAGNTEIKTNCSKACNWVTEPTRTTWTQPSTDTPRTS
jgi:Sulfatase